MIRPTWALVLCVIAFTAGCGSDGDDAAESPGTSDVTSSASTATEASTTAESTGNASPLVGRWERANQCSELVMALKQEGLAPIAPAMVGDYFPATNPKQLAQKDDLCEGARPIVHSHFFDVAGAFGSLDESQAQVDDGTYEINDDRTFVISKEFPDVTFHFQIKGEDLTLSPVVTEEMKKEAMAHPLEFSPAGWAISVSYPGHQWQRADCAGWC